MGLSVGLISVLRAIPGPAGELHRWRPGWVGVLQALPYAPGLGVSQGNALSKFLLLVCQFHPYALGAYEDVFNRYLLSAISNLYSGV